MHFSHALVTALSVIATQSNALPLRNGATGSSLQSRGINGWQERAIDTLTSRGLNINAARESVGVFARYADVKDEGERNLFIARDLSKRGILDMLVAALRDLIVELLGKGGQARKRDSDQTSQSLQQLTGLDFSTKNAARQSWSQMLDALSKALEQESKTLKSKAGNTTASASSAGGEKAKGTATSSVNSSQATGSVNGTASASVDGTAPSSSVTAASAAAERKVDTPRQGNKAAKRAENIMDLAERQEEGVTGLLQVLRNLVDAILNTLLPMSSRSEDSSSESSSSSKECPPPGTPNDGMYRPGCPGYGRREVTDALLQVRDAASSSQSLQELMPLLEELIQRIPEMMGGSGIGASTNANTTTASTQSENGNTKASSDGSASTSTKQKTAAPMSAAKLSINARSLLEADGFEMEKRQSGNSLADAITQLVDSLLEGLLGTETNSTNITDTTDSATGAAKKNKSSSDDSSSSILMSLLSSLNKRDGGLNVEGLNDILGNLLSGQGSTQSAGLTNDKRDGGLNIDLLNNLLGNLLSGSGSSQSSNLNNGNNTDDKRDGGLNLNLLNNLLGNLLSGSGSRQSSDSNNKRDGGLNLNLLNGLLGNLLSGDNSAQSSDSNNNKRDGGLNLNLLNNLLGNLLSGDNSSQSSNSNNKRADFQPVWAELKNLGNKHFSASASAERRDGSASFSPVWSSFRDMVDDAYKHGVERRSPLPSPSPKVDTSAFTHAAATFMKQTIFKQHDRRSINGQQFQPLMNAAGSFAKSQMKEWTDALNEHSSKHGKIHA